MKELCLLIQGPTDYHAQIIKAYSEYKYVIWITWESEPFDNLNAIRNSGILLHLVELPNFKGIQNSYLQSYSVCEGLKFSERLNEDFYFIKVRSDFIISPLNFFLEKANQLDSSQLMFLGYCKYSKDPYFLDYIVGGNRKSLSKYFESDNSAALPFGHPFPELYFQNRYWNFVNPIITKANDFQLIDIDNVKIFWLKRGADITQLSFKIVLNTRLNRIKRVLLSIKFYFDKLAIKK